MRKVWLFIDVDKCCSCLYGLNVSTSPMALWYIKGSFANLQSIHVLTEEVHPYNLTILV